jgi:hypothetical protein
MAYAILVRAVTWSGFTACVQVRDHFACHVASGKSCVACNFVSGNLAVYEGLQLAFRVQKATTETSINSHTSDSGRPDHGKYGL